MKQILRLLDPYRQSMLYFKWGFWSVLLFILIFLWLWTHRNGILVEGLLHNMFVYVPNYFTHEMAGHNLLGKISWGILNTLNSSWGMADWGLALTVYLSGSFTEVLIPFLACLGALRLSGGRYLLPPLLYWLASACYSAGIYISDARACSLPLTSSNLIDNFAPGTPGDWNYILKPFGLLPYDILLGNIFFFISVFCLLLAIWSAYYYWTHTEQYLYTETPQIRYYQK